MAKSPPSTPFYWNDYFRDTRVLSPQARGIWMDMLCQLHESGRRGEITLPLSSWLSWCSCPQDVFEVALQEISLTQVGVVLINNGTCPDFVQISHESVPVLVTVKSRRMMREEKSRQYEKLRKRAQRSTERVTSHVPVSSQESPPVPSSSSSSSSSDYYNPPNPLNAVDKPPEMHGGLLGISHDSEVRSGGGFSKLSDALRSLIGQHIELPDLAKQGER